MKLDFKKFAFVSLLFIASNHPLHAALVTYDLVAEQTVNGSTLTGFIVWDLAVVGPTLSNATAFEFSYTPAGPGVLSPPPLFFGTGSVFSGDLFFSGSVGDEELFQNTFAAFASTAIFEDGSTGGLQIGVDPGGFGTHPLWGAFPPMAVSGDFTDGALNGTAPDWKYVRHSVVPVPAAIWLFSTALIGLVGYSKRRKST